MTTRYCHTCSWPCIAITSKVRSPAEFCMYQGVGKDRATWVEFGEPSRSPLTCLCKQCADRKCRIIIRDGVKIPNACPWEYDRFVDWKPQRARYEVSAE